MKDDKEALRAILRGDKLPQSMVRRLWREGLIEVDEATQLQSTGMEYVPSVLTPLGQKMLDE